MNISSKTKQRYGGGQTEQASIMTAHCRPALTVSWNDGLQWLSSAVSSRHCYSVSVGWGLSLVSSFFHSSLGALAAGCGGVPFLVLGGIYSKDCR